MKISCNLSFTPPRRLALPGSVALDQVHPSSPVGPQPVGLQKLLDLVGGPKPPFDRVRIQTEFLEKLRQKGVSTGSIPEAKNALDSGFPVHFQGDAAGLRHCYREAVAQGSLTQAQADQALARLQSGEQVPEPGLALSADPALAAKLPAETILASSGSTQALANAVGGSDRVIGLRFPPPADRARVVEVVPGEATSPETLAKTLAYVRAIGKSPLVVASSPGLVLERVSLNLVNQGLRLFDELKSGEPQLDQLLATQIDQVALQTFWPRAFGKSPEETRKRVLTPMKAASGPDRASLSRALEAMHQGLGPGYAPAVGLQKGAPAPLSQLVEVPKALKLRIQERLQAAVMGAACQLLDEGVARPEDLERGLKAGLDWEIGPLELANEMGPRKALKLVEKLGAGFEICPALESKISFWGEQPFDFHYVDSHVEDSTAFITLNKPQRGNALDPKMLEELAAAVKAADADPSVRHIVLESAFNRQFTQGADLSWVNEAAKSFEKESWLVGVANLFGVAIPPFKMLGQYWTFRNVPKPYFNKGLASMAEIAASSKPTIAKIEGHALGGGLELGLACDYIVASENANLGFPEVHHGIFPAWGGTERLPQRIGRPLARWMILEGGYFSSGGSGPSMLTGQEARNLGLVDRVAPADRLDEAVRQLIQSGAADHKAEHNPDSIDLSGTRFESLRQRYATASTKDLLEHELAGLYNVPAEPEQQVRMKAVMTDAVELADARVHAGLKAHPEGDLLRSMRNSLKVSRLRSTFEKA
ncbi:enoyl-CoA hydratase/isomerase family protein [bacterium]|nr:enoyl-CoA hydratase/isomerase family protein [bacterium]